MAALIPSRADFGDRNYQFVTPAIVGELRALVGEAHVIYDDVERMADYSHDEVTGAGYARFPEVVVRPESAEQISAILRLANRERIPVTPRGAGSGLSGGAVPVLGGILLSLERMNRILEIDLDNLIVVVEPGVITSEINEALREHRLFYAGYPMSLETCFIGGNIAENAGGGRAIKYGVTDRYVLGLEVVLPSGEIVMVGGKRVKDVTGYNLLHLLVGSEGTLGIFTKILLRLLPLPVARMVTLLPFQDVAGAVAAIPRVLTQSGIVPSAVEFMDRAALELAYSYAGEKLPHPKANAMLLIEVDGSNEEQVQADLERLVELCLDAGALDAYVASTPTQIKKMWHPRQGIAEAIFSRYPYQSAEDLVVPMANIPLLVERIVPLAERYGILHTSFGHVGDGNVHVHLMKKPEMPGETFDALLPNVLTDLYRIVAELGGTISGEHGIGTKRAKYLPMVLEPELIALQQRIKDAFDPLGILNPGKIFPSS